MKVADFRLLHLHMGPSWSWVRDRGEFQEIPWRQKTRIPERRRLCVIIHSAILIQYKYKYRLVTDRRTDAL